jgi:hypothetical protein
MSALRTLPGPANLYISLPRTAGILDVPVAEISRLRANHAFPRNYNLRADLLGWAEAKLSPPRRSSSDGVEEA